MSRIPGKNPWLAALFLAIVFVAARMWPDVEDFGDQYGSIDAAFAAGQSDVWVTGEGVIRNVLRDDTHGSQHQRLIVALPSGLTVLIAHNIDLAPRVQNPRRGARIRFHGEYEWNDKGGVVHWTHHDPDGDIEGGWIEFEGRRYR